jgi:hypothetical protein
MDVRLTLPDEMLEALGPNPEREILEGLLLLLVGEGRLSLERAGEVLGLEDRERSGGTQEHVSPGDFTQEIAKRSRKFLRITPAAKDSGLSDVSINHDKYLAEDA